MDNSEATASPQAEGTPAASRRKVYEPPTFVPLGTAQEAMASFQSFSIP